MAVIEGICYRIGNWRSAALHFSILAAGPNETALPRAVGWVAATLTGPLATGVAVIAVAGFGFGMLTGRLDLKSGLRLVLGAFILFGAPMIAREIAGMARGDGVAVPEDVVANEPSAPPAVPQNAPDPYAGAAMIQ